MSSYLEPLASLTPAVRDAAIGLLSLAIAGLVRVVWALSNRVSALEATLAERDRDAPSGRRA